MKHDSSKSYKIAVSYLTHTTEDLDEIQDLFEKLGYRKGGTILNDETTYIGTFHSMKPHFTSTSWCELENHTLITVQQLKDMVVLERNEGMVKTRLVEGFGKNYIVSNLGQVFSVARTGNWKLTQLKPNISHKGYSRVTLKNGGECKTLSLHRIVAYAFIENPLGKPQVNHINGIKSDNDVANLEWCTPKENIHHALKTGLTKVSSGEKKSQLTNADVLQIVHRYHNGEMLKEISKDYPVSAQALSSIVNGRSWSSVTGIQHPCNVSLQKLNSAV